jgi:tetratricopeptide (TPR) repeat protein
MHALSDCRRAAALLLGLFVAFVASAALGGKIPVTSGSPDARSYFLEGRVLVDNLRLTDAIPYFQHAVQIDTAFALGHLYLALTATNGPDFFASLENAVRLSSNASEGEQLWIRGVRAGAFADPAAQRDLYRKLVALYPADERALTLLGINYFGQQEYAEAASHLERAVKLSPDFAPAYNQLGYAYRFLGKHDRAEATFKKYIALIPHDPNPYDSYAELLLKLGRFDEAITQYRKALSVRSPFPNSRTGIAAALTYQERHTEALKEMRAAFDEARNDAERRGAIFASVVIHVDRGEFESALRELERQEQIAAESGDAGAMAADQTARGNMLLESGKPDQALAAFARALDIIQKSSLAADVKENARRVHLYNMSRVLAQQRHFTEAEEQATLLLKEANARGNRNQARLAHEALGLAALNAGKHEEAISELEQASQQNPLNLYRLAAAHQAAGHAEKAREACTQAAQFNSLPNLNYALVRKSAARMLGTL